MVGVSDFALKAGRFRNEIIGTISLAALLVAIFRIEVIIAGVNGYSSSQSLLSASSKESKIALTALLGPFIHQGPGHLMGNLGVLLAAGSYIEYEYERTPLYVFYLGVGYIAAWTPLPLGFVGAVGASGVTYGLTSWVLIHSLSRVFEMAYDSTVDRRILHLAPLIFGLIQTRKAIYILGSVEGADDITHLMGAFLGVVLGIKLTLNHQGIWLSDR